MMCAGCGRARAAAGRGNPGEEGEGEGAVWVGGGGWGGVRVVGRWVGARVAGLRRRGRGVGGGRGLPVRTLHEVQGIGGG
jgi:hypothetical protein